MMIARGLPLLLVLLLLCGADYAGAQSVETDAAALRDFYNGDDSATWTAGEYGHGGSTWTNSTSPCGDGWDDGSLVSGAGWIGITCCANGRDDCTAGANWGPSTNAGRVTCVNQQRF